jgi:hypothetical protein
MCPARLKNRLKPRNLIGGGVDGRYRSSMPA